MKYGIAEERGRYEVATNIADQDDAERYRYLRGIGALDSYVKERDRRHMDTQVDEAIDALIDSSLHVCNPGK